MIHTSRDTSTVALRAASEGFGSVVKILP